MQQLYSETQPSINADLDACRDLLRGGSRSFYAASLFLPRHVRDSAIALYAFCRLADDIMDLGEDDDGLEQLQRRLDGIYTYSPGPSAADRALSEVVFRHHIPRELFEALLEGFAWDAAGRDYEDLSSVLDYSARVAGTVGAMMSLIMGERSPEALARACDLGIAMQLTNITRDVGEDARNGRLYLPRQWMREVGLDPEAWLENPEFSPELATVVQRLLDVAEDLYARASTGIAMLPRGCRPSMHAARLLYREIGHEVRRRGLNSVDQRAVVPRSRKLWRLTNAVGAALRSAKSSVRPPLPEAVFLVEAAIDRQTTVTPASRRFSDRVVWVIDLFESLERFDRFKRTGPELAVR